jgi:hypothetical protein
VGRRVAALRAYLIVDQGKAEGVVSERMMMMIIMIGTGSDGTIEAELSIGTTVSFWSRTFCTLTADGDGVPR